MPKPGQFTLHSNSIPSLAGGSYTVNVSQTLNAPNSSVAPRSAAIEIVAPRFTLAPDQLLSTFPPNQSVGMFSTRLPQIVLRRRSLPWERSILPANPRIPWLALVLVADGEAELKTNLPVAQCITGDVTLSSYRDATVGDALYTNSSMVGWIFPRQSDLELLAHVRDVDLDDTELALGDDDGLMAVIIGNRLPQPGTHYTACLVSLEGQFNRLLPRPPDPGTGDAGFVGSGGGTAGPQAPQALTPVPLIFPVLAHWSFSCTGEGDFQSLAQDLDVGMLGEPPGVRTPGPGQPPPPPRRSTPPEVLLSGHITLDHLTREGDAGRALYRGPLLPQPGTRDVPGPDGTLPLLHAAEQAIRIDAYGRENLSLAAAFELGRLLALAEPAVVAALLLWRKDGFAQALVATLLQAEPGLAPLGDAADAGRGFAARAGVHLLAALGEREALGSPRPLVEPGATVPGVDDADPLSIVAEGLGIDRARLAAALSPGGEPLGAAEAAAPPAVATDEFARLRAALADAVAQLAGAETEEKS